jgi:hypothetical protein
MTDQTCFVCAAPINREQEVMDYKQVCLTCAEAVYLALEEDWEHHREACESFGGEGWGERHEAYPKMLEIKAHLSDLCPQCKRLHL